MDNIAETLQSMVTEMRDKIAFAKTVFSGRKSNFSSLEVPLDAADKAIREQDTTTMLKLFSTIEQMLDDG